MAGVALGVTVILGMIAGGLLIWSRKLQVRHDAFKYARSMEVHESGIVPSDSVDLTLELDGKGEPILLGQGSFAKVLVTLI